MIRMTRKAPRRMARTKTPPQRLTSVEHAARYADVGTRTIRRWIATGRLRAYRVGPRLVKIDLDDLDRIAVPIPTAGGGPDAAA
jgi:excisionase family DNA binding protein